MEKIRVRKEELLGVLNENRAQHRTLFQQALDGYKQRAVGLLEDHIRRIQNGKVEQVQVYLPAPEDHTRDYDRAIRMVEMSVEDEIVLSEKDFQMYVQDDWSWKREFTATVATYTGQDE